MEIIISKDVEVAILNTELKNQYTVITSPEGNNYVILSEETFDNKYLNN